MHTNRLDQTINDSKFWLETYTKSFKDNAQQIAEYRLDFEGRIDALMFLQTA
jgi:hypothetical protein